jgi:hypothetical protein
MADPKISVDTPPCIQDSYARLKIQHNAKLPTFLKVSHIQHTFVVLKIILFIIRIYTVYFFIFFLCIWLHEALLPKQEMQHNKKRERSILILT